MSAIERGTPGCASTGRGRSGGSSSTGRAGLRKGRRALRQLYQIRRLRLRHALWALGPADRPRSAPRRGDPRGQASGRAWTSRPKNLLVHNVWAFRLWRRVLEASRRKPRPPGRVAATGNPSGSGSTMESPSVSRTRPGHTGHPLRVKRPTAGARSRGHRYRSEPRAYEDHARAGFAAFDHGLQERGERAQVIRHHRASFLSGRSSNRRIVCSQVPSAVPLCEGDGVHTRLPQPSGHLAGDVLIEQKTHGIIPRPRGATGCDCVASRES